MVNNDLPTEDEILCGLLADGLERQAKDIIREADVLKKIARTAAESCGKIRAAHLQNTEDVPPADKVRESFLRFYASALAHTHAMYESIVRPNHAEGLLNPREVQQQNFDAFEREIEGIFAFISEQKIFFRLPLLPAKINHGIRQYGRNSGQKYFYFFNRELDECLRRLEHEIPRFQEQTITYMSSFEPGMKSVFDCDNIDTKSITDTICLHTMCDDSPLKTSFFYCGINDGRLTQGTYVCVSQGRFAVPEIDSIVRAFQGSKTY